MELEHDFGELGNHLVTLCLTYPPDWDEINALICKVDVNLEGHDNNQPGATMLSDIIYGYYDICHGGSPECTECVHSLCILCHLRKYSGSALPQIVKLFLDNGFDVSKCDGLFGAQCLDRLQFSSGDVYILDTAKLLLHAGADPGLRADPFDPPPVNVLHNIASESDFLLFEYYDSYTHDLLATLYKIMDASVNGEDFDQINSFESIIGKRLDKILICSRETTPELSYLEKDASKKWHAFQEPIVLICEGIHLCIDASFSLMVDPRIVQKSNMHTDVSTLCQSCIGQSITDISLFPQGDPYHPGIYKQIVFGNGKVICIAELSEPNLGAFRLYTCTS